MFQLAVVRYGLATSLALLASVPFLVGMTAGPDAAAVTAFVLSFFSAEWLLFQPSLRSGEGFRDARARVLRNLVRDPLFWFALAAALFACARWLNGGAELVYDPEQEAWSVSEPWAAALPTSVKGPGLYFFAVTLSLLVLVSGVREGLGKSARAMCLLVAVTVAGISGVVVVVAAAAGHPGVVKEAGKGLMSASWCGDVFAVWFVAAAAALGQVEERGWRKAGLPAAFVAVAGCGAGMVLLCPPLVAAGAVAVGLVAAALSIFFAGANAGLVAATRVLVAFSLAAAVPFVALSATAPEEVWKGKAAALAPADALTEREREQRAALVENAEAMWMEHPWLGVGVGAYALNAPFHVEKDGWSRLPKVIKFVPNGYATLAAERGIAGCLLALAGLLLLVGSGAARFVSGFRAAARDSDAPSPFLAVPPVCWAQLPLLAFLAAEMFFTSSPVLQPQAWAAAVFVLALASASFPARAGRAAPAPAPAETAEPTEK